MAFISVRYLKQKTNVKESLKFLVLNKKFVRAVKDIRKKWDIDTCDYFAPVPVEECAFDCQSCSDSHEHITHLCEDRKFNADVSSLMSDMKIPEEMTSTLENYVICGSLPLPIDEDLDGIYLEERQGESGDPYTGVSKFFIRIYPTTTIQDIKDAWPAISKFVKTKESKRVTTRKKQYLKRDLRIFELYEQGVKQKDIPPIIKKEFNQLPDIGQIKSIIQTTKKRRADPFCK